MRLSVYVECHYAECHYAECHYAECCYADCHGTDKIANKRKQLGKMCLSVKHDSLLQKANLLMFKALLTKVKTHLLQV